MNILTKVWIIFNHRFIELTLYHLGFIQSFFLGRRVLVIDDFHIVFIALIFGGEFLPFCKNNILIQILYVLKRNLQETKNWKIAKNHHNCIKHEKVLQNFLLSYFFYHQIWLNILMDDHNLSKIKIEKKLLFIFFGAYFLINCSYFFIFISLHISYTIY